MKIEEYKAAVSDIKTDDAQKRNLINNLTGAGTQKNVKKHSRKAIWTTIVACVICAVLIPTLVIFFPSHNEAQPVIAYGLNEKFVREDNSTAIFTEAKISDGLTLDEKTFEGFYLVLVGELNFDEFSYNTQTDGAFLYSDEDNATELKFCAELSDALSGVELPLGSKKQIVKGKISLVYELSSSQYSALTDGKNATSLGDIRLILTDCYTTRNSATFPVWFVFDTEG